MSALLSALLFALLHLAAGAERRAWHPAFEPWSNHPAKDTVWPSTRTHSVVGKNTNALDFQPGVVVNANVTLPVAAASDLAAQSTGLTMEYWLYHRGCDNATTVGSSCKVMEYEGFSQTAYGSPHGHPTNYTVYHNAMLRSKLGSVEL